MNKLVFGRIVIWNKYRHYQIRVLRKKEKKKERKKEKRKERKEERSGCIVMVIVLKNGFDVWSSVVLWYHLRDCSDNP